MLHQTYELKLPGSLPGAKLVTYIHEYSPELALNLRPLVLVCPGGGYAGTSDREAEIMALQYMAMGYHAAVLRYSCAPARYPTALLEAAYSMQLIRRQAKEWHVDADRILIQGCSAGGHLAASLGVFWQEEFIRETLGETDSRIFRPDGMILCYPVITAGEYAHRGSFECLLGEREEELKDKMSLEYQVSADTPPTFIWHTFEDQAVPVENSLLFVGAMRKAGVPVEFHLYPKGGHGLGLANHLTADRNGGAVQVECGGWIELVKGWIG